MHRAKRNKTEAQGKQLRRLIAAPAHPHPVPQAKVAKPTQDPTLQGSQPNTNEKRCENTQITMQDARRASTHVMCKRPGITLKSQPTAKAICQRRPESHGEDQSASDDVGRAAPNPKATTPEVQNHRGRSQPRRRPISHNDAGRRQPPPQVQNAPSISRQRPPMPNRRKTRQQIDPSIAPQCRRDSAGPESPPLPGKEDAAAQRRQRPRRQAAAPRNREGAKPMRGKRAATGAPAHPAACARPNWTRTQGAPTLIKLMKSGSLK